MTEPLTDEEAPLAPAQGWKPEDFPRLSFVPITYTTDPLMRPDPRITITPEGWLFIAAGNTQLTIPTWEDWLRLVNMITRMKNSHDKAKEQGQDFMAPPPEPPNGETGPHV